MPTKILPDFRGDWFLDTDLKSYPRLKRCVEPETAYYDEVLLMFSPTSGYLLNGGTEVDYELTPEWYQDFDGTVEIENQN